MVVLAEHLRPKQRDAYRLDAGAQRTQLLKEINVDQADFEQLQMIVIAKEPWSIENGSLTRP
ncbi:hypothetical protein [Rhodoferax sp. PAMC 29310]|uniref:hypothetical protein n=1 Tax=Rhodoferax sp. PAMC 29310 TaxID=2822760 RepID=UPI001B331041|nr:hypothetical protein [Rhodoferax sp. PAMC 29310]